MKQLVDELKTKKFSQEWGHLEPPLLTISRDQCDRLIIHLLIKCVGVQVLQVSCRCSLKLPPNDVVD